MLINLHIVNLALIDELDVDFAEGLNILTGETGAGKSIIIGSIGIGLGGRFEKSLLRDPEKDAVVELLFSVDDRIAAALAEDEIDAEGGEVLISRRLTQSGSVNRINDRTVTLAKLRHVAEMLISLHAQHEQRTLLKVEKHLELVDSYSNEVPAAKAEVASLYKEYKSLIDKLDSMQGDSAERAKRLDYLKYEIDEIEAARLVSGEDEELEEVFRKASNSQEIAEITSEVMRLTGDSGDGAGGNISRALRELTPLSRLDEASQDLISTLTDIDSLMSEFNQSLSEYALDMEYDESTLRETESRLNVINSLKARYGNSIDEILSGLEDMKKEADELENYDVALLALTKEKDELEKKLAKASDKLTELRKKAAGQFTKTVADSMQELNFNDVRLEMRFDKAGFTANGQDKAELYLSTNVGEEMKPLSDVASGGELSRVMLAIKSVMSETEDTPTLIFDEIDVGISGITAGKVGEKMRDIASTRQVIAITHLPQIAAAADTSYVIEKEVKGDKTITGIRRLDAEGRVDELARLLGGADITDTVRDAAREMLNK